MKTTRVDEIYAAFNEARALFREEAGRTILTDYVNSIVKSQARDYAD